MKRRIVWSIVALLVAGAAGSGWYFSREQKRSSTHPNPIRVRAAYHSLFLTFACTSPKNNKSGLVAVARLIQGISPKHCSLPVHRVEDFRRNATLLKSEFR
jgi:hypothetical protein